jgi:hypothetical protein
MQTSFAIIALRQIAEQAQNFALFGDGNNPIGLGGEIEPSDFGVCESADGRNRRARDSFGVCEIRDGGERFFALLQH